MTSSIIHDLQAAAMRNDQNMTSLMQQAFLVSSKLNLQEFETWVKRELFGYEAEDSVPSYRKLKVQLCTPPLIPGEPPVPMTITGNSSLGAEIEKVLSEFEMRNPIGAIESMISAEWVIGCAVPIPQSLKNKLPFADSITGEKPDIVRSLTRHQLQTIIDVVRGKVLEWSLTLEQKGILGIGLSFSDVEKKNVHNADASINYNNCTIISNSSIQQFGNQENIISQMQNSEIPQETLDKIKNLFDEIRDAHSAGKNTQPILQKGLKWFQKNKETLGMWYESAVNYYKTFQ